MIKSSRGYEYITSILTFKNEFWLGTSVSSLTVVGSVFHYPEDLLVGMAMWSIPSGPCHNRESDILPKKTLIPCFMDNAGYQKIIKNIDLDQDHDHWTYWSSKSQSDHEKISDLDQDHLKGSPFECIEINVLHTAGL